MASSRWACPPFVVPEGDHCCQNRMECSWPANHSSKQIRCFLGESAWVSAPASRIAETVECRCWQQENVNVFEDLAGNTFSASFDIA